MTRLQQLRLDALLTPEELGERVNLHANTIRNLETGRVGEGAHIRTLAKLSTFFGVKASELLLPADRERAA